MTDNNIKPNQADQGPVDWEAPSHWDVEDAAIAEAMQRISVDPHVTARVRARLRAVAAGEVPAVGATSLGSDDGYDDDRQQPPATPLRAAKHRWKRGPILTAGLALVASITFLAFWFRPQPLTEHQLSRYSVDQLELISNQLSQWKSPAPNASSRLEPLLRNLNRRLTLVGSQQLAGSPVAASCTVWKFDTGQGKNLYVLDFHAPRTVRDIPGRFRVIQQSSTSWSLAALQQADRLLVVAIEGDISDYLKSLEWA
jgi:hypothetical protein